MPHRIAFVTQRFEPDIGGVARSASRIARALAALGAEVEVYTWSRALPPGEEAVGTPAPGVTLHRLGPFAGEDLSAQTLLALLEDRHRRRAFSLCWGHYLLPCGQLATLFARLCGIPAVVSARGNDVDRLVFPPGDFARLAWTLEQATRVVAVSAELARKIAAVVPAARVSVLHNAVDPAVFAPGAADPELRKRLGLDPAAPVLGFSGELRHKKGAPALFAALAKLAGRRAQLLLIGEPRAREREQLERLRQLEPAVAARVVVTGHLEDPRQVAAHLCCCDLLLLPSLWEGLPNALLEGMACALPVLATRVGGVGEVVRHGVDGLLIERDELGRLDEAIAELLDAPEARQRLGAAARERVLQAFAPAQEAQALARLLAELPSSSS